VQIGFAGGGSGGAARFAIGDAVVLAHAHRIANAVRMAVGHRATSRVP
jgi:hypothetical protein